MTGATGATGTAVAAMLAAHHTAAGRPIARIVAGFAAGFVAAALTTAVLLTVRVPSPDAVRLTLLTVAAWPWWSALAGSMLPPAPNAVLPQHLRGVPISGRVFVAGAVTARLWASVRGGPAVVLGAGAGASVSLGSAVPAIVAGAAVSIRAVTAVAAMLPGHAPRLVLAVGAGVVTAAGARDPITAVPVSVVAAMIVTAVAIRGTDAVLSGVDDGETDVPDEVQWGRFPVIRAVVVELVRSRRWGEVFPPAVATVGVGAAALTGTELVSVLAVPAVLATTGLAHCVWTCPETVGAIVTVPDGLRRYLSARAAVASVLAAPCAVVAAVAIGRADGPASGVVVIAVFLGCALRAGWRATTTRGPAARPILVDLLVAAVASSVLLGLASSTPAATGWAIAATASVSVAAATVILARRLHDGGAAWHAAVA
ncbi:hypothetical protein [Rhodococcoides corynebacterioides]|uniref:hypothetical protein n=1 Tax=Rhodococcoides corynebacterioides TaxID=53972 RepID=UPI000830BDEF|nr:hypothetical protein [Rhodococcus corynebacterioides]MBY6352233.1 hypothetical protein [Rhodococcus corynebacterioides]